MFKCLHTHTDRHTDTAFYSLGLILTLCQASSSSILKSPGGSGAGKQANRQTSRKISRQALRGHSVRAMPFWGLLKFKNQSFYVRFSKLNL